MGSALLCGIQYIMIENVPFYEKRSVLPERDGGLSGAFIMRMAPEDLIISWVNKRCMRRYFY